MTGNYLDCKDYTLPTIILFAFYIEMTNGYTLYVNHWLLPFWFSCTAHTGLYEHMEGLTNDVEKSNETVIISNLFFYYLKLQADTVI
jgi:hypothetical protein